MTQPTTTTYIFLSGAEMEPSAIRAAYPAGRFVSRGWIEARGGEIAVPFAERIAPSGMGELWGIIIALPGDAAPTERRRQLHTDEGSLLEGWLGTDKLCSGDPAQVVAAARYYELPPVHVLKLMDAIGAQLQSVVE